MGLVFPLTSQPSQASDVETLASCLSLWLLVAEASGPAAPPAVRPGAFPEVRLGASAVAPQDWLF